MALLQLLSTVAVHQQVVRCCFASVQSLGKTISLWRFNAMQTGIRKHEIRLQYLWRESYACLWLPRTACATRHPKNVRLLTYLRVSRTNAVWTRLGGYFPKIPRDISATRRK